MNKAKEELTSEEVKLEASEIKKHIANLLTYMDDERKDYEAQLETKPDEAKEHIWLDIKAIADWIAKRIKNE